MTNRKELEEKLKENLNLPAGNKLVCECLGEVLDRLEVLEKTKVQDRVDPKEIDFLG